MDEAPINVFCRQVRARSRENSGALRCLHGAEKGFVSPMFSILRQELDSMIRAIYLLSIVDMGYRNALLLASIENRPWKTENGPTITDRMMVDLAQKLQGWTQSVYTFGCAFVHLSSFHDHRHRDPVRAISPNERAAILRHMRYYRGGPAGPEFSFDDLVPYLPGVSEKISRNLECYLRDLEVGKVVDQAITE
jgi:hypothetical protein